MYMYICISVYISINVFTYILINTAVERAADRMRAEEVEGCIYISTYTYTYIHIHQKEITYICISLYIHINICTCTHINTAVERAADRTRAEEVEEVHREAAVAALARKTAALDLHTSKTLVCE